MIRSRVQWSTLLVTLAEDLAAALRPGGRMLASGIFIDRAADVIAAFDLGSSAILVELDLEAVERLGAVTPRYRPIPRVPAVTRDLSLVVKDDVIAGKVAEVLERAAGELCESLEVVADFRGNPVPSGQRSLTFRVVYRDPKARRGESDGRDRNRAAGEGEKAPLVQQAHGRSPVM